MRISKAKLQELSSSSLRTSILESKKEPLSMKPPGGKVDTWFSHLWWPIDSFIVSRAFFRPKNHPYGATQYEPPAKTNINFEDVYIKTTDGLILHGYFFPSKEKTENTILFFHGRSGNVNHYYLTCLKLQDGLSDVGKNVNAFIFDYRGYGKSKGRRPTRQTVLKDAFAAYSFLRINKSIPANKISLIGHSGGAAVALAFTLKLKENGENINSVIAASPYSSPKKAAIAAFKLKDRKIPLYLLALVNNKLLNPEKLVKNLKEIPLIFVHGEKDKLFSIDHSKVLYALASTTNKQLILLKEAAHIDLFNHLNEEHFKLLAKCFD